MIQQKSGNIPARSPLQLLGSRLLHLFLTEKSTAQNLSRPPIFSLCTCSQSLSSMTFFQTISSKNLSTPPVFPFFSLYSHQPLKTPHLLPRIPLCFLLFPFLFQKIRMLLYFPCRIFSFHMCVATLIHFSSQIISLTFLSAHTLVRVEQQPLHILIKQQKNENKEKKKKNQKSQQSCNLSKIRIK